MNSCGAHQRGRGAPPLADEPLDWRFKGLPAAWWGRTPAQISRGTRAVRRGRRRARCAYCTPRPDAQPRRRWRDGAASAASSWRRTARRTCRRSCCARQFDAGAARSPPRPSDRSHLPRVRRPRGGAGQRARRRRRAALAGRRIGRVTPIRLICWVDSVRGRRADDRRRCMAARADAGRRLRRTRPAGRPHRLPRATPSTRRPRRGRLSRGCGWSASRVRGRAGPRAHARAPARVADYLAELRSAVIRLAPLFETDRVDRHCGRQHLLRRRRRRLTGWPAGMAVRTILRSGCYLTHDDGLYARTSPLTRDGRRGLRRALRYGPRWCRGPSPSWRS